MARASSAIQSEDVPEDSSDRAVNRRVAAVFDAIADMLEIERANPFRIRAYRTAAHELRHLGRDLAAMAAAGEDLTEVPGIGEDLAAKIGEILETGRCRALDELHARWPESLHAVLRVPGVGPSRARALFEKLGVRTLEELQAAAQASKIQELPGFGPRSERNILDALAGLLGTGRRLGLAEARVDAERLLARLRDAPGVHEVVIAGSYRRARATVGDLDILVTARPRSGAIASLVSAPGVAHVLAEGPTRAAVVLRTGLQVDLRVVGRDSFGAALHYFTGSKAHNIAIRRLGVARGLKINEYGVFRGDRRVAGRTEASVFAAVGLPMIPPELRENRGEIAAAREGRLPTLVEPHDLRGDLVLVPATGDPTAVVAAAAAVARTRDLAYLVIVHEVPTRSRALDWPARLHAAAEAAATRALPVLQGLEYDLSHQPADVSAGPAEFVAGRLPPAARLPPRPAPAALRLAGVAHPGDALGDLAPLLRAAQPTVLVADGDPAELPGLEPRLRAARDAGLVVLLGSGGEPGGGEASRLELAVSQARRAWLGAGDVANTRPLAELRRLLGARDPAPRAGQRS